MGPMPCRKKRPGGGNIAGVERAHVRSWHSGNVRHPAGPGHPNYPRSGSGRDPESGTLLAGEPHQPLPEPGRPAQQGHAAPARGKSRPTTRRRTRLGRRWSLRRRRFP